MIPRPILVLEINEVPWKVLDLYLNNKDYPNISKFFESEETYTTISNDDRELSPWITWPSFHRGLNNCDHGIRFLGQDPISFKGVPIWEEYTKKNFSIGICGSLQSWPPIDPGKNGFYLPDTFALDSRCYPSHLEPIQKFNLDQVKKNGRVVNKKSFKISDGLRLSKDLIKAGISVHTIKELVKQLSFEHFYPYRKSYRPIFQGVLFWDIFCKCFNSHNPPSFSTYFTNHIAGLMHRYWHHIFWQDED
ncbi:MAG: hypothetical protein AB8G05_20800 [Oligoflexales bacterium]